MENITVAQLIENVCEDICDNYCKFSDLFKIIDSDAEYDKLLEQYCDNCPLNKLR